MSTARRRSTSSPWTRSSASDSTVATSSVRGSTASATAGGPERLCGPPPPGPPPVPPRPDRCAPRSCQPLLDLAPHERLDGGEGDLDRLAGDPAPGPVPGAGPRGRPPRGGGVEADQAGAPLGAPSLDLVVGPARWAVRRAPDGPRSVAPTDARDEDHGVVGLGGLPGRGGGG